MFLKFSIMLFSVMFVQASSAGGISPGNYTISIDSFGGCKIIPIDNNAQKTEEPKPDPVSGSFSSGEDIPLDQLFEEPSIKDTLSTMDISPKIPTSIGISFAAGSVKDMSREDAEKMYLMFDSASKTGSDVMLRFAIPSNSKENRLQKDRLEILKLIADTYGVETIKKSDINNNNLNLFKLSLSKM